MRTRVLMCLLVFGLVACLTGNTSANDLPDLRFTEDSVDFGCVAVDFKIYHTYKMVNHGKGVIHIDTVTPHCDCTQVRFRDSVLGPGDTATFLMIFNTADFYGPVEKDIRVHSDDKKSPKAYSYYRANIGQWLFSVQPQPVSVFMLPVKSSKTGALMNHALDKISVTELVLDDESVCEIKLLKSEAAKGEKIEYEVTIAPGLSSGNHLTNFTMTIDLHQDLPPLKITIPVKIVRY